MKDSAFNGSVRSRGGLALFYILMLGLLLSCGGSGGGGETGGGSTTATAATDTTVPTVGAGISFTGVGATTITVNWGAASDNVTSVASLEYKLVKDNTATANINAVATADAKSGADLLQDWTANITSKALTALSSSTTYHFAVLVRDAAGNKAIYTPATQATATAGTLTSPTFSPVAGTYGSTQMITITNAEGQTICYTTNGTTPAATTAGTCSTGTTLASGANFSLPASATVKAIATQVAMTNSAEASAAYVIDTVAPVVGTALSFTGVSNTGLTVNWGAATDAATAQASLQYKVVKDDSALINIDTVSEADAKSGGDLLQDWATNITTKAVTSLTASTTYYFAVLVRDSVGNKAIYAPVAQATAAPGTLSTPTFSPVAGTYGGAQNITITNAEGQTICYTTNGTTPDATTPGTCSTGTTLASGANFSLPATATVKAIATQAAMTNSSVASAAYVIDTTAPTAGTALSFASIATTTLTVNWGAGTDGITTQANLQYKVVKDDSALANIDTIAEADAKTAGDLLQDWTANITTKAVTGLTASTNYHFAVLVRDEAGNKALYAPVTQGTTSGSSVGDVVINEIMWMGSYDNAGTADTNDEFIELRNTTGSSKDISNWTISGTGINAVTIPASQSIAANGYYVIARNATAAFTMADYNKSSTLGISNTNFQLILRDPGNVTIDTANVSAPLAGGNDTTSKIRKSMERRTTGTDGTLAASWFTCSAVGTKVAAGYSTKTIATPGEANSSPVFSVASAAPASSTTVVVSFNEVPTAGGGATGAANTANYSIPGIASISGAVLSGSNVTLTGSAQTASQAYTVTVSNVTAASGGASLTGNTANFTGFELPKVKSVTAVNATTIDVNFQKPMDSATIDTLTGAFVFNNGLTASAVVLQTAAPNANQRVRITTGSQTAGTAYTLTVNNSVQDAGGYGVDAAANTGTTYGFSPLFGTMEQLTAGMEGANATYWTNSGAGTLNNNTGTFFQAANALTWATLTTNCTGGRTATSIAYYPITPGGSYTGSIYAKTNTVSGGGTLSIRMRMMWFKDNVGTVSATANTLDSGAMALSAASAWTQDSQSFTAPTDAFFVQFRIHACYTAPAAGADQLYFDQAYFGP